jgi:hypothetical protein
MDDLLFLRPVHQTFVRRIPSGILFFIKCVNHIAGVITLCLFHSPVLFPSRSLRLRGLFLSVFTPRAAEQLRKVYEYPMSRIMENS